MPLVSVTRKSHFNAAHRLHNPAKSDEWNRATFGKCNSPNWHGHNYQLEVTVVGEPDPDTGYVMDLADLQHIIQERIIDPCDHSNLNLDVDFLKDLIPSSENLVVAFWNQIEPHIKRGKLSSIKLFETSRNVVEYCGNP
ncbi:MAG: 6-carboxytetrahydropterin synthase [Bacteroidetes bacterium]|nr:6-carboxytetrahydropterin synthase [Bacteroidota bacterium]